MKNLTILGSTGSIGCNALEIVRKFPDRFCVKALSGALNIDLLYKQVNEFKPDIVAVLDEKLAIKLSKRKPGLNIVYGEEGYKKVASYSESDIVISAIVGAAGLIPNIAAIESGKDIALANKETLVMAGEIVMTLAKKNKVSIIPVDSEHSAIFQCMSCQRKQDMESILLTASGGPFLHSDIDFESVKPEHALKHPNWKMGKKITIDSATLMNKGFEVIEAKHLFEIETEKIKVIVHPESIIHSMVSYKDGSVIAQLGLPDMKAAIAYALSYPERLPLNQGIPDFVSLGSLNFYEPDLKKFPCLDLAFQACKMGYTYPAVLNAANEVAVWAFLDKKITFAQIPEIIAKTLDNYKLTTKNPELSDILNADSWARKYLKNILT